MRVVVVVAVVVMGMMLGAWISPWTTEDIYKRASVQG
jgi:hypothetical protein